MSERISRYGVRYIAQRFGMLILFGGFIFLSAGSWTWLRGWVALAVCFLSESIVNTVLAARAPNTLNERGTPHAGVKRFDFLFATIYLTLSICLAAVIGFDCVRFQWSLLPWSAFALGLCLMIAATVIGTWAMLENAHFEQFVRIQSDRQHQVVTSGPYRLVRHPGYLAAVLGAIAGPFLFGSAWSFIPATFIVVTLAWRTLREDLTLLDELEGYSDYTQQTRRRLLPLIW